uniref:VP5B n=1 Tax=Callinectes sapidus reovirus 2 TaxID=2789658 RepID=A0A8K1M7Y4_9REOV|nr:VP5B [Callinectes sapidus reovirus 2]
MEAVASMYGNVVRPASSWDVMPDHALWEFTISDLSRYTALTPYVDRMKGLKDNICVYVAVTVVESDSDDIKEIFRCPCGVHRELIICVSERLQVYTDHISTSVSRIIRKEITVGNFNIHHLIAHCAYCDEPVRESRVVTDRVYDVRRHLAHELKVDDGVRLCYCNKSNACRCYLEESVGFGCCVPMLYASEGHNAGHSTWCNRCEYPRFCTTPIVNHNIADTLLNARNGGTAEVPFRHEYNVVPLRMMPVLSRILQKCLSVIGVRRTVYLQSGCDHDGALMCACDSGDVLTDTVFVDTCITYSMAMWLRSALASRGITLVTECIMCSKTHLCPEREMNALHEYGDICVGLSKNSVCIQGTEQVQDRQQADLILHG